MTFVPAASNSDLNLNICSIYFSCSVSSTILVAPVTANFFLSYIFSYYLLSFSKSFSIPSTKSFASADLLWVLYISSKYSLINTHDGLLLVLIQSDPNLNDWRSHLLWFNFAKYHLVYHLDPYRFSFPSSFICFSWILLESWIPLRNLVSPIKDWFG